jgi:cellulose synthase/poly-beta-1,6-N-acetylglucosamine synthase-like glycosyltransferase
MEALGQVFQFDGRIILDWLHILFGSVFYFSLSVVLVISIFITFMTLSVMFFNRTKKERGFDLGQAPSVTVQIPTRNEVIALRCARKCLESDYPKDKLQILIGDDSNRIEVSEEIDAFAARHPEIEVIRRNENVGFKSGNLNNMLSHSKGEIIITFDSDFAPEKDFIKRIVAPFVHDREVAAVQARWKFINEEQNIITKYSAATLYTWHHIMLPFMKIFNSASLCGSAQALRKQELIELGKWQEGCLAEDIEFSLRLIKSYKKMLYLDSLECFSEVPCKAMDFYKQQLRWAYGTIETYILHLKDILSDRKIEVKKKITNSLPLISYMFALFMLILTTAGIFSLISESLIVLIDRPSIDWNKIFSRFVIITIFSSGWIYATFVSVYKAGKIKSMAKILFALFTVGFITLFYITAAIIKAIFKIPLVWYQSEKSTNYKNIS